MSTFWQKICKDDISLRYRFGTWRTVAPADTLRRIRPLLPRAGITRLADITGLDWVGLPVYQAIRPNSRNVSVSQGKGLTRLQAQVSALMESLESFHAEELKLPVVRMSTTAMTQELDYDPYALPTVRATRGALPLQLDYDPYAPPVGTPAALRETTPIDWVAATDLWTSAATWVPKQLCELNFEVDERLDVPLFRASSNGLASGNTTFEALFHALCEVIERDAMWRNQDARLDPDRCIALPTITSRLARRLLSRFAHAGLTVQIVDVSGPTGLPCFEAYLNHDHPGPTASYYGAGCHPSRTVALLRALTEAAQSRLAYIAGSRDDLYRRTYRSTSHFPTTAANEGSLVVARGNFRSAPTFALSSPMTMLSELVRRVRLVTGMSPMMVDLRRPDFGLPVVYVVAPGLHLNPPKRR